MLRDLSLEHINTAINAIGYEARFHKCEGHIITCHRADIIEIFDKYGAQRGTVVGPRKVFIWNSGEYKIETVWDIKRIIQKYPQKARFNANEW